MVEFREKIKEIRLKTGLSQEKFAELIGVHRTNYLSFEKGRRSLPIEALQKVAEIPSAEVTISQLMGWRLQDEYPPEAIIQAFIDTHPNIDTQTKEELTELVKNAKVDK